MISEMSHLAKLDEKQFTFNPQRYNFLRIFAILLSLLINIIILLAYDRYASHSESLIYIEYIGVMDTTIVITVLASLLICSGCLILIFWLIVKAPLVLQKLWRIQIRATKMKIEEDDTDSNPF